ncbi:MAG: hypothetical protein JNM63_17715, partial [Spirochaetia bacterium]|nr:hypothetical protein [Spirochaetia bacterium]
IKSPSDFASAFTGKPAWGNGFYIQRADPPWVGKTVRTCDFVLDLGARAEGVMGKENRWDDSQKKFVNAPLPSCAAAGANVSLVAEIYYKDKQSGTRVQGQKNIDIVFSAPPANLKPVSGGEVVLSIPETPIRIFPDKKIAPVNPGYIGAHFNAGSITPLDWETIAPRRFPSQGLGVGAMFRTFLPGRPRQKETIQGVVYERPNRNWWTHILSSEVDRGVGPECNYRYYQSDFRMLLGWAESIGATEFVVAPGFPYQTKETTMAAVAYANGKVGDTTVIGVDKWGEDWKTVGYWAEKRAKGDERHSPHPEPFGVKYWEIGNEEYYSHNSVSWSNWLFLENYDNTAAGRNSATRAGLYIDGRDFNGERCDGFLEYFKGMKKVDPTIRIAAMLAPEHKAKWHWDWNETLLTRLKGVADLFTYHGYTHSSTLDGKGVALQAGLEGRRYITNIRAHMIATGNGNVPLANSEWHAYEPIKAGSLHMTTAIYNADMHGIMLEEKLAFNTSYGPFDTKHGNDGGWTTMVRPYNANDYKNNRPGEGIYDRPSGFRWPSYYGFYIWKNFGDSLVAVENPWDNARQISMYAGTGKNGLTLIAVNKSGSAQTLRISAERLSGEMTVDEVAPAKGNVSDEDVTYNNISMSTPEAQTMDDLDQIPPAAKVAPVNGEYRLVMKPWSITRLRWAK